MGKLEDLDVLQKLKDSGAITPDEFEKVKNKVLADDVVDSNNQIKEDVKEIDHKETVMDQVKEHDDITDTLDNKVDTNKNGTITIKFNHLVIGIIIAILCITLVMTIIFKLQKDNQNIISNSNEIDITSDNVEQVNETFVENDDIVEEKNLLEQIEAIDPNNEYPVCIGEYGDYTEYWILDSEGKKIRFSDIDGFKEAIEIYKERANNTSENLEKSDINNNKEDLNNSDADNSNRYKTEIELKYDLITNGMSYYEVYNILGKPNHKTNGTNKTCTWLKDEMIIMIRFFDNKVLVKTIDENKKNEYNLDPATTRLIDFGEGYPLEDYLEDLNEWGVKYKVVKEENLEYKHNVVTKIEPNGCYIDKNTVITFTVSDNTYDMNVVVDVLYLLKLAGISNETYIENYDYDLGRYVGTNVKLVLKINGETIYNGNIETLSILHSTPIGEIRGKSTDKYNIDVTIEGVEVKEKINYYTRCNVDYQTFEICESSEYGGG